MDSYNNKETARLAMRDAIQNYKEAAENYGSYETQMADEIEQALSDVGLNFEVCA